MNKPTLFFIHGMWSTPDIFTPFADWFEGAGYTVRRATLRHHDVRPDDPVPEELGGTSLLDYAADLESELKEFDEPPVIIGHSMGGALAQMLAARGLGRAAVLLCPAPLAGRQAVWEVLSPSVAYTLMPSLLTKSLFGKPTRLGWHRARFSELNVLTEQEAREKYADFISESGRVLFELGLWFLDRRKASWVDMANIRQPAFTAAGGRDRIVTAWSVASTARKLARNNRANTYVEYPQHGHWIIGEPGWQAVAEDIRGWLESLGNGA
ncbi:MAG: alpha/beta hydrolase [Gammaproteobacteria bacterium]|nr:alpha/beta hydrolase [Gammaproteobacteria bacterium]